MDELIDKYHKALERVQNMESTEIFKAYMEDKLFIEQTKAKEADIDTRFTI